MVFKETLITSLTALKSNLGRTFLTTLGVIIGVFAVVSLVSLVTGVQNYVKDAFENIGSNLIYIMPGSGGFANDPALSFSNNKFESKHVDLIKRNAGDQVLAITPYTGIAKNVKYKTKTFFGAISGVNEDFERLFNVKFDEGKFFNRFDVRSKRHVAVLGSKVKEELFGTSNVLGKNIKIGDVTFTIVGSIKQIDPDIDNAVVIPETTLAQEFNTKLYTYIIAQAKSADQIEYAKKSIEIALLQDLKSDQFTLYSATDLLQSINQILNILQIALAAIAGISLLVGGIGIMNIMLVSVTERIREIGLRKALGATSFDIGLQFILEAVIVSLLGGLFGLFLGWIVTLIANIWIRAEITAWSVGLAIGFSILVGIVFGTYPALDAAKKDPIEALRYE